MRSIGNITARSATQNQSVVARRGISWWICSGKFKIFKRSVVMGTTDRSWNNNPPSLQSLLNSHSFPYKQNSKCKLITWEVNYDNVRRKKKVRKSYLHYFFSAAAFLFKHSATIPYHYYIYFFLLHTGFPSFSNVTAAGGRFLTNPYTSCHAPAVRSECQNDKVQ